MAVRTAYWQFSYLLSKHTLCAHQNRLKKTVKTIIHNPYFEKKSRRIIYKISIRGEAKGRGMGTHCMDL